MNTITQTMRFRQALIEYSLKYGVTILSTNETKKLPMENTMEFTPLETI